MFSSRTIPWQRSSALWGWYSVLLCHSLGTLVQGFSFDYGIVTYGCVWKCCVPLNPMVNDHYPYQMAISLGIYPTFSDKPILWSIVALQQLHDLSKVNRVWKLLFFNLRFGLGALILLLGILFFALLSEEADFGPPICSRVVAGHSLLRFKRAECASFLTMRRCQLFKERCWTSWTSIQNIDSNQMQPACSAFFMNMGYCMLDMFAWAMSFNAATARMK